MTSNCTACGKTFVAGQPSVAIGGERFHPDCFKCGKCNRAIKGQFSTKEGMRICTECVPMKFCEACKKALSGKIINHGGKAYHAECFVCHSCSSPLGTSFFPKDGFLYCKDCAKASGKKVVEKCRKCQKKLEEGADIREIGGDKYCSTCVVCVRCSKELGDEYEIDQELKSKGEFCLFCKACKVKEDESRAQAAADKAAKPCIMCKQTCTVDDIHLIDGTALRTACFKCSMCDATIDKSKADRVTVDQLRKGRLACDACKKIMQAEEGTFSGMGKSKDGKADVTYCIRLMDQCQFWMDFTSKTPIASSSWHAEGHFRRKAKDAGAIVTLKVECCPFGGGPEVGSEYTVEVEPGAKAVVYDGVRCTPMEAAEEKGMGLPEDVPPENPVVSASSAPKATAAASAPADPPPSAAGSGGSLTLEQLKDKKVCDEHGVDASHKEARLSDADFEQAFKMNREAFDKLPKWQKEKKKKELGLF